MITKTTYKLLEYHGVIHLQYLKVYKVWFFFKRKKWLAIPFPNEIGRSQVVCTLVHEFHNIKKFIIKYPDIEEYFKTEYVERKNRFKKVNHK